jgi:competence protein ComEA
VKRLIASIVIALCSSISVAAVTDAKTPSVTLPDIQAEVSLHKVNLNTADAETLQRELSGVGAVKAQAIISYREQHGNFASTDELLEVKGIGEALFEKNRDKISVN